jgi:hypothetical protein
MRLRSVGLALAVAAAAATQASAQPRDRVVYNARPVITADWSCSKRIESPGGARGGYHTPYDRTYILSLRPGANWDGGTVWLLRSDSSYATEYGMVPAQIAAWKGYYNIQFDPDERDVIKLKVGLTRKFRGRERQGAIEWEVEQSYRPQGARLDTPLENDTVTTDPLVFSFIYTIAVDPAGKEVARQAPASVDFLQRGDVLKMKPADPARLLIARSPPPGFSLRR